MQPYGSKGRMFDCGCCGSVVSAKIYKGRSEQFKRSYRSMKRSERNQAKQDIRKEGRED